MNGLQMRYFVLKPRGDDAYAKASRIAMKAYAQAIHEDNPEMAKDLMEWVGAEAARARGNEPLEA